MSGNQTGKGVGGSGVCLSKQPSGKGQGAGNVVKAKAGVWVKAKGHVYAGKGTKMQVCRQVITEN